MAVNLRIDWTVWAIEHIARHGVRWTDVEEVLNSGTYYARKQRNRIIAIGRARRGVLFIVLERSIQVPDSFEVITCRQATSSERDLFIHRGKGAR